MNTNQPLYNTIGQNYTGNRRTDPRIAEQIYAHLQGAKRIVNIGAGSGSYEPADTELVAVEPADAMLAQRKPGAQMARVAIAKRVSFSLRNLLFLVRNHQPL